MEVSVNSIIESDSLAVEQSGTWYVGNADTASEGAFLYSSGDVSDVLSLEFDGHAVAIIFIKGPLYGVFAIEIDNVIRRTVVTSGDESFDNRAVIDYLGDGHHIVRVYPVEGIIAIDAFVLE